MEKEKQEYILVPRELLSEAISYIAGMGYTRTEEVSNQLLACYKNVYTFKEKEGEKKKKTVLPLDRLAFCLLHSK